MFENLNTYLSIINNACKENRVKLKHNDPKFVYYEEHHIKPKSIFPESTDDKRLKVLLTAKEHLHVHLLLCGIFKYDIKSYAKCLYALRQMMVCKKHNNKSIRFLEKDYIYLKSNFKSECDLYSKVREDFSRIHSTRNISQATRKKQSEWQKGKKLSEKHKNKIGAALKGKPLSEMHKHNLAGSKYGNKNGIKTLREDETKFIDSLIQERKSIRDIIHLFKINFKYGRPKLINKYFESKE
jgi:hypothetical protein